MTARSCLKTACVNPSSSNTLLLSVISDGIPSFLALACLLYSMSRITLMTFIVLRAYLHSQISSKWVSHMGLALETAKRDTQLFESPPLCICERTQLSLVHGDSHSG
uniref:Uncharacterized protein n=1 Tax=Odontella aurita TaxID=265563 RepID=A0A7S4N6W0_9STRA|mmetsp:Transcript_49602/g.149482  ORF Transcript_49602/g.149482 Transcript_49602/m.149482 type:complete len:107 (+) Transcript_49602:62-382(+)